MQGPTRRSSLAPGVLELHSGQPLDVGGPQSAVHLHAHVQRRRDLHVLLPDPRGDDAGPRERSARRLGRPRAMTAWPGPKDQFTGLYRMEHATTLRVLDEP